MWNNLQEEVVEEGIIIMLKGHLNRLFMDRKGLAGYETNVGKRTLISLDELNYRTCFCTVSGSCSNTA